MYFYSIIDIKYWPNHMLTTWIVVGYKSCAQVNDGLKYSTEMITFLELVKKAPRLCFIGQIFIASDREVHLCVKFGTRNLLKFKTIGKNCGKFETHFFLPGLNTCLKIFFFFQHFKVKYHNTIDNIFRDKFELGEMLKLCVVMWMPGKKLILRRLDYD